MKLSRVCHPAPSVVLATSNERRKDVGEVGPSDMGESTTGRGW